MDIAIRSVEEVSAVSGQAFMPGDRVWSYLYRNEEGLIDRIDCLEAERENIPPREGIICSWGHVIKEKGVSEAEERRAALQSAEDVFLSLYEGNQDESSPDETLLDETRDRLKFFLALQLERKRILKPLGNRRYRHMPSKREFVVPDVPIDPEMLTRFQQEIALMSGDPT